MQYKTVTIEHPKRLKKDVAPELNAEYEQMINEQAVDGWKLLGIHPIEIRRKISCGQWCIGGFMFGSHNYFQADVLIFFKD